MLSQTVWRELVSKINYDSLLPWGSKYADYYMFNLNISLLRLECSHQRAVSWFSSLLALSLTPCFSASLLVFDDAINKINQLAGG